MSKTTKTITVGEAIEMLSKHDWSLPLYFENDDTKFEDKGEVITSVSEAVGNQGGYVTINSRAND